MSTAMLINNIEFLATEYQRLSSELEQLVRAEAKIHRLYGGGTSGHLKTFSNIGTTAAQMSVIMEGTWQRMLAVGGRPLFLKLFSELIAFQPEVINVLSDSSAGYLGFLRAVRAHWDSAQEAWEHALRLATNPEA